MYLRYIKQNGKTCGPYLYECRRYYGCVKTKYLGRYAGLAKTTAGAMKEMASIDAKALTHVKAANAKALTHVKALDAKASAHVAKASAHVNNIKADDAKASAHVKAAGAVFAKASAHVKEQIAGMTQAVGCSLRHHRYSLIGPVWAVRQRLKGRPKG